MGRGRTSRAPLGRKLGNREPKAKIYAICEGSRTEPSYLRLVSKSSRDAVVELIIIDEAATSPWELVDVGCAHLERLKSPRSNPYADRDQVWIVFDIDEHPKLKQAKQRAEEKGLHLAISNPSVEIWFLLHFQDCTAHIHRDEALKAVEFHIPGYDKKFSDLGPLSGRQSLAVERAARLAAKHAGDGTAFPHDNPSTGMAELIKALGSNY